MTYANPLAVVSVSNAGVLVTFAPLWRSLDVWGFELTLAAADY